MPAGVVPPAVTVGMINQVTVAVCPGLMTPLPLTSEIPCNVGGWTKNKVEESLATPLEARSGFWKVRLAAKPVMALFASLSVIVKVAWKPIRSKVNCCEMTILIWLQIPCCCSWPKAFHGRMSRHNKMRQTRSFTWPPPLFGEQCSSAPQPRLNRGRAHDGP